MDGNRFKDFRVNILQMTQTGLAERLGIHRETVSRMERGESEIDKTTRLAMAALALGIGEFDGGREITFQLEPMTDKGVRGQVTSASAAS